MVQNAVFAGSFGGATENEQQTEWIKQYWRSLSRDDFHKMVKLLTGRIVFPAGGVKVLPSLKMNFSPIRAEDINPPLKIEPVVDSIIVPLFDTQVKLEQEFDEAFTIWRTL